MVLRRLFNPVANNPLFLPGLQLWNQATGPLSTDGAVNLVSASSQSLSVASNSSLQGGSGFSIACWFFVTGFAATYNLVQKGFDTGSQEYQLATFNALSTVALTTTVGSVSITGLSANQWNLVVATYDGAGNLAISVNNSNFTTASGASVTNGGSTFCIGKDSGGFGFMNGQISETAFWQGIAISQAKVGLLWAGGAGLDYRSWPSSLLTGLVSVYQFTVPGNLGLDYFGSNTLTLNNAPTYAAGKVVGTPSITGESVSVVGDSSGNNNAASQTTGANRYTLQLNQINGLPALRSSGTSAVYSLLSSIPLSGVFTLYAACIRTTLTNLTPISGASSPFLTIFGDNNEYFQNDASSQVKTGFTGAATFLVRFRRDISNNVYCAATGMSEVLIGNLSGTATMTRILGGVISTANGNQFAELILSNQDNVTTGGNTQMIAYLQQRYNLSLP